MAFVDVPTFMNKSVFDFWIARPIKEKRAYGFQRLRILIKAVCLRRTHKLLQSTFQLPHHDEREVWVELTPKDRALYRFIEKKTAAIASGFYRQEPGYSAANRKDTNIVSLINFLRLICDHGESLLSPSAIEAWKNKRNGSIDWEMMQATQQVCELCGDVLDDAESQTAASLDFPCLHCICVICCEKAKSGAVETEWLCPKCTEQVPELDEWNSPSAKSTAPPILPSPKVKALIENLRQEQGSSKQSKAKQPVKR